MASVGEKIAGFLSNVASLFGLRREGGPIDGVAALEDFIATRSAYIAQKTLYGYVKTRMGIRYVAMFEDKAIIASLNIAKVEVVAACLSDLTIYAVANALHASGADSDAYRALARRCYLAGLRQDTADAPEPFSAQAAIDEFETRLAMTDWQEGARQPDIFTRSPQALYRWAPIDDKLKKFDRVIVENSVKFAWRDVREQFQKRLNASAVATDWAQHSRV
jgi:hypothetical protein